MVFYLKVVALILFLIYVEYLNAECNTIAGKCQFPFNFDGKTYDKCTRDNKDVAWCVTNKTKFDQSAYWKDPANETIKLGWETCDDNCEVEDARDCDESRCQFPFTYNNHSYITCTQMDYYYQDSDQGWCMTNQTQWREVKWHYEYSKPVGWTTCSSKCSFENVAITVCDECQFPFVFRGKEYYKCTRNHSPSRDPITKEYKPWCITDISLFENSINGHEGWAYCSSDCQTQDFEEGGYNSGNVLQKPKKPI